MKVQWSPGYFGVNFALSAQGSTPPPPPPPAGGTPVANHNYDYEQLKVAA